MAERSGQEPLHKGRKRLSCVKNLLDSMGKAPEARSAHCEDRALASCDGPYHARYNKRACVVLIYAKLFVEDSPIADFDIQCVASAEQMLASVKLVKKFGVVDDR